jgi:hypothetical protein
MAMVVTAFSHKTLLGLDRICIRFSAKPDTSVIRAVKTFDAKYRKAKAAPPCWYLPADKADALSRHLAGMNSGEEVDQLSAALEPFLTPAPEAEAPAEAPAEAAAEAAPEAAPETAPEEDEPPRALKRLRVTECRLSRECQACTYEAQMMAQDGGFAQMYHTCMQSESQ